MYEELVTRCHANARNGISAKDIALREAAYAIENKEKFKKRYRRNYDHE